MAGLGERIVLGRLRQGRLGARAGASHPDLNSAEPSTSQEGSKRVVRSGAASGSHIRKTIESEIVPRLMLTHTRLGRERSREPRRLGMDDVAEFARIVVAHDTSTARSFLEAIQVEGVEVEGILFELFAPAARLLGDLWAADRCSFADVTVGLSHIERLTQEMCSSTEHLDARPGLGRVVLAPAPGEQHTLGLHLVAFLLQRDGWDVTHLPVATEFELVQLVQTQEVDMLGVSVSSSERVTRISPFIKKVRKTSKNRCVLVMVGGACFDDPNDPVRAGADATASDARSVVEFMRRHYARVVSARDR